MAELGASGAGIAAIGRALIAPASERDDACAVALGERPARRDAGAARAPSSSPSRPPATLPDVPGDIGKALGKLFGR
jgi:hypothetical protein